MNVSALISRLPPAVPCQSHSILDQIGANLGSLAFFMIIHVLVGALGWLGSRRRGVRHERRWQAMIGGAAEALVQLNPCFTAFNAASIGVNFSRIFLVLVLHNISLLIGFMMCPRTVHF